MSILSEEELNPPQAPGRMHELDHFEKALFGSAYPEHLPLLYVYVCVIHCYPLTSLNHCADAEHGCIFCRLTHMPHR